MKRIAFLADGWRHFIGSNQLAGLTSFIEKKAEEEIFLDMYQAWGNWSRDEVYNQGEYNIFNLADLNRYDGVVVDFSNISDREVLEHLIRRLKESQLPVVSLGSKVADFPVVEPDDDTAIYEMTLHLGENHGAKTFAFAAGPKGNYENERRVEAFLRGVRELGIADSNVRVLYRDYGIENGKDMMREIAESGSVPDAIVCANDNIAVGVTLVAKELGLRVPEDLMVTGYDYFDKAPYFDPQITSGEQSREKGAERAAEVLYEAWNGKTHPPIIRIPSPVHYSESCGCPNSGLVDYRAFAKDSVMKGVEARDHGANFETFSSDISGLTTLDELSECLIRHYQSFGCDEVYIVLDRRLRDADPDTEFPTTGYVLSELEVFAGSDEWSKNADHTAEELYEHLLELGGPANCVYMPCHIESKSIGFVAVRNARFDADYSDVWEMQQRVMSVIVDWYHDKQMEKAMKRLQHVYNRDWLTGAYARTALESKAIPIFEWCIENNVELLVGFADADYFKEINDTYGHEYGDRVLVEIVREIKAILPSKGICCRYGGDEFLIVTPCPDTKVYEERLKTMEEKLKENNLSISMGIVSSKEAEIGWTLDDYINEADRRMYEMKRTRHSNHGIS